MPRNLIEEGQGKAFRRAAEAAKRKLYPELFFTDDEYITPACRVCHGVGAHTEDCGLRNPDKKDKALVEDLLNIAGDAEQAVKKKEVETLENPSKPLDNK
jgi:hypothetical protein